MLCPIPVYRKGSCSLASDVKYRFLGGACWEQGAGADFVRRRARIGRHSWLR